jgi:predicted RNA-binding Zn-ribbon protein involved in translation (DUF1610 family)
VRGGTLLLQTIKALLAWGAALMLLGAALAFALPTCGLSLLLLLLLYPLWRVCKVFGTGKTILYRCNDCGFSQFGWA